MDCTRPRTPLVIVIVIVIAIVVVIIVVIVIIIARVGGMSRKALKYHEARVSWVSTGRMSSTKALAITQNDYIRGVNPGNQYDYGG